MIGNLLSVKQIQALIKARRGLNWDDQRQRSPKALGDFSGVILSRIGGNPSVGVQDFDYDVLAKLHICNDIIWSCINLLSTTAALGKLKVRKKSGKQLEFLPDHPLQKMLDSPNASMTQFDLIQSYVVHQNLFGNISIILLREEMAADTCELCVGGPDCLHKLFIHSEGPIVTMMPVHPSKIIWKEFNDNGKKKRYAFYTPEPNKEHPIHPNNLFTDPLYNTEEGWFGISPTFIIKRWAELDHAMTSQLTKYFENGAIPSMIINLKPGNTFGYTQEPETLVTMMKEKWQEQFGSGGNKQKSPAFTFGDISVEKLEDNVESMVAKGLYYEIQGRICAIYGIPPTLYEMGMRFGAQRSNGEQVEKDFYNRTISKILFRLLSKINNLVVPSYNEEGLEVVWDLSEMGIASFIIQDKQTAILKHWEVGIIQRDTARALLGYEPVGGEFGDDFYRLTVMSDGKNASQAAGMDNRLKQPQVNAGTDNSSTPVKTTLDL